MEDPKKILSRSENYLPEYINMAPYSDAKRIFEKGKQNFNTLYLKIISLFKTERRQINEVLNISSFSDFVCYRLLFVFFCLFFHINIDRNITDEVNLSVHLPANYDSI